MRRTRLSPVGADLSPCPSHHDSPQTHTFAPPPPPTTPPVTMTNPRTIRFLRIPLTWTLPSLALLSNPSQREKTSLPHHPHTLTPSHSHQPTAECIVVLIQAILLHGNPPLHSGPLKLDLVLPLEWAGLARLTRDL